MKRWKDGKKGEAVGKGKGENFPDPKIWDCAGGRDGLVVVWEDN